MNTIDAFWAGARAIGDQVDVLEVARAAGGWEPLKAAGAPELVAWGVEPALAHAWLSARPESTQGEVITLEDEGYPSLLRAMPRPPPVLCFQGHREVLQMPGVAVVGTRSCTRYGASLARRLGAELAQGGCLVVSGLARGIDGEAHRGALEWGRTLAVLGHGLDHTAPARHRPLRHQLIDAGGAVVSAWPDRLPPRPHTFPKRNAWIAGWCSATVVVEAPFKSGAMHTARFAAAMGRDVYAVPGRVGDANAQGPNELISEGAGVVLSASRLVEELTGRASSRAPSVWLDAVLDGATVQEAAERSGRSVRWVLTRLSALEVQGRLVRVPGGRYASVHGGSP